MRPREVRVIVGHEGADAGGRGDMRASDVERELTIDVLKAAFMQGRLTKDELAERVGRALASRTYTDLDSLTADIPREAAARRLISAPVPRPAGPALPRTRAPVDAYAGRYDRAFVATALFSGLTIVAAFVLNDGATSGLLALIGILSGLISMALLAAHVRAERRGERQGGQRRPRRALGTSPAN
jgi:Domain of unknown function (DUF1707)